MATLKIKGDIIPNGLKPAYDYFSLESTAPLDVEKALSELPKGERLTLKINSGGGDVFAGQEIYSMLLERDDVDVEVESVAASAASMIAMAAPCRMSPVAVIMIHNVSTSGVYGDHNAMTKMASTLKEMDAALAQAYVHKTGKAEDEILKLMDKETWLTANRAIELGFADGLMDTSNVRMAAGIGRLALTDEMLEEYKKAMALKAELVSDLDRFGK